jgi:predicted alpha/beta-hydrolase family hydrolase
MVAKIATEKPASVMSDPPAPPEFMFNGPKNARLTLVLAHGAGSFMDSDFMNAFAEGLVVQGRGSLRVARFEFPYMVARRDDGRRRPPNPESVLLETWRRAIAALGTENLAIGGKSLGGRMASMIADECGVRAVVCLGYPFHPQGNPEKLRVAHLTTLQTPTLIVQGTRDALGSEDEVQRYPLSPSIALYWIEDGDHNLTPRKSSGRSVSQTWTESISAIGDFLSRH